PAHDARLNGIRDLAQPGGYLLRRQREPRLPRRQGPDDALLASPAPWTLLGCGEPGQDQQQRESDPGTCHRPPVLISSKSVDVVERAVELSTEGKAGRKDPGRSGGVRQIRSSGDPPVGCKAARPRAPAGSSRAAGGPGSQRRITFSRPAFTSRV